jgi:CRISPR-associated protein Csd1
MSALASLVHAYDRLAERGEVPVFGYSVEKTGFLISLNEDGRRRGCPSICARAKERRGHRI